MHRVQTGIGIGIQGARQPTYSGSKQTWVGLGTVCKFLHPECVTAEFRNMHTVPSPTHICLALNVLLAPCMPIPMPVFCSYTCLALCMSSPMQ